jgi:hypothetical protein
VKFDVQVGNPVTPVDEADVLVNGSITDVRKQGTLTDYAGQLQIGTTVRITDHGNGGSTGSDPATVSDIPLGIGMTCAATASTSIGGDCSVSTSLDALVPGTITEGARANWQLGEVTVLDGGSDGLMSTGPNTAFARQGVFVP